MTPSRPSSYPSPKRAGWKAPYRCSVKHWAAASLLYRVAGLQQSTDRCVRDPALMAVRSRISIVGDPALTSDAARVTVVLKDGSALRAHVAHCRGRLERPMSDDDLGRKFRGQAETVLAGPVAGKLLMQCWRVRELDDVGALAKKYFQNELTKKE